MDGTADGQGAGGLAGGGREPYASDPHRASTESASSRLLTPLIVTLTCRELEQTTETLVQVQTERDTLRVALEATSEARDRWREAAQLRLFGLPPELTHGLALGVGLVTGLAAP